MIRVRARSGDSHGILSLKDQRWPCRLGRAGVVPADDKREGDGATPAGEWPLRRLFYRPDRLATPDCALETVPLSPAHLWCDDPGHSAYNQLAMAPFDGCHETLWRDDHRYDLVVELGYNDRPPVAGLGSAIFLHLTEADGGPTAGCVAVDQAVLLALLPSMNVGDGLSVELSH